MNLWFKVASVLLAAASFSAGQTATASNPSSAGPATGIVSGSDKGSAEKPVAVNPVGQNTTQNTTVAQKATGLELTSPEIPEALEPVPVRPPSSAPAQSAPTAGSAGPASSPSSDTPVKGSGATDDSRYVLGPNDTVQVNVWDSKNLSGPYRIGPDGRMSMFLIGDFKATGMTTVQLGDLITERLRTRGGILEPIVNVQLAQNNSKQYTLMGDVQRTGPFPLLRETTIVDALAASGGFKDFAKKNKIVLTRGSKQFLFNYTDVVIKHKHPEQNIKVEDGDMIYVPGE